MQAIREMNRREVKLDQMRTRRTFKVKQETSSPTERGVKTTKQNPENKEKHQEFLPWLTRTMTLEIQ